MLQILKYLKLKPMKSGLSILNINIVNIARYPNTTLN